MGHHGGKVEVVCWLFVVYINTVPAYYKKTISLDYYLYQIFLFIKMFSSEVYYNYFDDGVVGE